MSTEAVDYIFRTLAANYGSDWDRSLGNAPISDVKTVWLDAIEPYTRTDSGKKVIMWALKNLPDRVPNVRQFASLCRQAPAIDVPKLPEPKADPARVAQEMAKLAPLRSVPMDRVDHRAWARTILAEIDAGIKRSPAVVQMARNALRWAA